MNLPPQLTALTRAPTILIAKTSLAVIAACTIIAGCQSATEQADLSKPVGQAYVVSLQTMPSGAECFVDGNAENLRVTSPGQLRIPLDYKNAKIVCTKEGHETVSDYWFPGSDAAAPAISWVRTLPKKK